MKILGRYIINQILQSVLLILVILIGLEILVSFVDQLSDIGTGDYTLWVAIKFVILDMPYQVYSFFPMAALIGSLLGLGAMASQNELVVMQASGISIWQVAVAVLKAAGILLIIAIILGEVIAPSAENTANLSRAIAKSGGQMLHTSQGLWLREGNTFIFVDKVLDENHLENIQSYQFNQDQQLEKITYAKYAVNQQQRWQLQDTTTAYITPNKIDIQKIPEQVWNTNLQTNLLQLAGQGPRNMMLPDLYRYIHYLKANGLNADNYALDFWKRIFAPFAALVMLLLAIPFVFGSLRQVTLGVRLLVGIVVGFAFYMLNQFIAPISLLYQIPPILAASVPIILFAGLAIWWMAVKV